MYRRKLTTWIACALVLMLAHEAWAAQPWKQLPPTPSLPAGTVGKHVTVNGARIWYAEWNAGAAGVPVLLLHGGFGNSSYFGHLIPVLIKQNQRVIAVDSRGHGRSSAPENEQITYNLMGEDVVSLLDRLGVSKVSLVGWSDGGCIGYELGINHPERLSRVFAFGCNADMSGLRADCDKTPTFAAYLARTQDEYRALSPTPARWDEFKANIGRMWATLPAYTAAQLASINVPVTVADGQYEECIKAEHNRYVAATIPGARLVFLPSVSHFAMLQNPRQFNAAVLTFLTQ